MRSRITASGSARVRLIAALLGALIIAGMLWTGSSLRLFDGNTVNLFQSPAEPERIIAHATYGKRYTSLSQLLEESTSVVSGRIVQDSNSHLEGDGVAFTEAVLKVDHVLLGTDIVQAQEIVISQTGGFEPRIGKIVELELEPLMRVGEEYLLFVRPQGPRNPGKWVVTGGYAGRFKIQNGNAYRPTPDDPLAQARETLSRDWNGNSVQALESAIRNIP